MHFLLSSKVQNHSGPVIAVMEDLHNPWSVLAVLPPAEVTQAGLEDVPDEVELDEDLLGDHLVAGLVGLDAGHGRRDVAHVKAARQDLPHQIARGYTARNDQCVVERLQDEGPRAATWQYHARETSPEGREPQHLGLRIPMQRDLDARTSSPGVDNADGLFPVMYFSLKLRSVRALLLLGRAV